MVSRHTRREMLRGTIGVLGVGLAGCTSNDSSTSTTRTKTTQRPTSTSATRTTPETSTSTETSRGNQETTETTATTDEPTTETPTPQGGSAEVAGSEIISAGSIVGGQDEDVPWIRTDIQNTRAEMHGGLQIEQLLYDGDDSLLEVRDGYIALIPGETTWRSYHRVSSFELDQLDHVEVRIVENDNEVSASPIAGASVVSSSMTAEPEGGVDIVGEIALENTNVDRVVMFGLVYDTQGRLRGTVRDSTRSPSETIAFSAGGPLIRTPPDIDQQVSSHEILVLNGFP